MITRVLLIRSAAATAFHYTPFVYAVRRRLMLDYATLILLIWRFTLLMPRVTRDFSLLHTVYAATIAAADAAAFAPD